MNNLQRTFFVLSIALILACGSDDPDEPKVTEIGITLVTVVDADNQGNAADLRVCFSPSDHEELVSEYRVIIAKASNTTGLTEASANTLAVDRYFSITPSGSVIETALPANLLDMDGDAITEGVAYSPGVLTMPRVNETVTADLFVSGTRVVLEKTDILETMVELPIGTGGVAIDAEGNVYCADFGTTLSGPPGDRVYRITPEGNASVFARGFRGASGNTFGPDGNLYQSNIQGGTVSVVTPNGAVSEYASGMRGPVGLIFDPDGNLYVANCSDNTIKRVTPEGRVNTFASGNLFSCPNGIAIDRDSNLYVANFGNGNVVKVTPNRETSVFATLPGNNNGHLTFYRNRLYVVARAVNQVYEVDLQGNSNLLVGSGQRGHEDGPALLGTLSLPNDLGFSPDGKYLYINDSKPVAGTPANSDIEPTFLKRVRLEKE